MEPWGSAFLVALLLLRWAYLLPKVPRKATLVYTFCFASRTELE